MISSLELARLCGVSQGTVDRALHGRPGVSAKTRALIKEQAGIYGYRPHPAARELLTGKSRVVGAIAPAGGSVFFLDFVAAIKSACDSAGLRLFITPAAAGAEFLDAVDDFAARRVCGIVGFPPVEGIRIPDAITRAFRVATLLSECANEDVPLFAPDETRTGEAAVDYLTTLGHRRILHLTYRREALAIKQRRDGYLEAMARGELEACVHVFSGAPEFRAACSEFRPTAVFCNNDRLALTAIRILQSAGMAVPRDISVMGVDNSPTFNEFEADITTMSYPFEEIARKAMRWVIEGVDERPVSDLAVVERASASRLHA